MDMTRSKWLALVCCAAVASCMHQPPLADVNPVTTRIALGAPPDLENRLLVKVHDGTTPRLPLGFASVTVTRVGADSIATAGHWDAQSRADGLAAFILPDSGLYEIDVRLIRRLSFRHRVRLTTRCLQSLDIYLEETSLTSPMSSREVAMPRSRGILTTCVAT